MLRTSATWEPWTVVLQEDDAKSLQDASHSKKLTLALHLKMLASIIVRTLDCTDTLHKHATKEAVRVGTDHVAKGITYRNPPTAESQGEIIVHALSMKNKTHTCELIYTNRCCFV